MSHSFPFPPLCLLQCTLDLLRNSRNVAKEEEEESGERNQVIKRGGRMENEEGFALFLHFLREVTHQLSEQFTNRRPMGKKRKMGRKSDPPVTQSSSRVVTDGRKRKERVDGWADPSP